MVYVTELKAYYLACVRRYFPASQLSPRTVFARSGKTHQHFETVARVLSTEHLDVERYLIFCFTVSERVPTPRQLSSSALLTRFLHTQRM